MLYPRKYHFLAVNFDFLTPQLYIPEYQYTTTYLFYSFAYKNCNFRYITPISAYKGNTNESLNAHKKT